MVETAGATGSSSTAGAEAEGRDAEPGEGSGESSTGVDTIDSFGGSGDEEIPPLMLACEAPSAAVGAAFRYAPSVDGAVGTVSFAATSLPDGLVIDPLTGEITGTPTEAGAFDVEVTVSTASQRDAVTCTIDVAEALRVALPDAACITAEDDLLAFVEGGDGSALSCSTPGRTGDGVIPEGVSIDPDTCAIEGTITASYGTWAWITYVEQAGRTIFVPYCATQTEQDPASYTITATHAGGGVLDPGVGTFAAGQDIAYGSASDPTFEVRGPCGDSGCFFGFAFRIGGVPFGDCGLDDCFTLDPSSAIQDGGSTVGFSHHMTALGGPVASPLAGRPFVLAWDLDYCISDQAVCSTGDEIRSNGDPSGLHFSVILSPE